MSRDEVREIAVMGATVMRVEAAKRPDTQWHFQSSPETFSTTELDFSIEVCAAVMEVLQTKPARPILLNLPATVEAEKTITYDDQIEYFSRNQTTRKSTAINRKEVSKDRNK